MIRLSIMTLMAALAGFSISTSLGDPTPKVIAIWPPGPMEVRIAFDRPADPALPARLVGTRIAFGDSMKVGTKLKQSALSDAKDPSVGSIRVTAARLEDDDRTLVLATDPHPRDTNYVFQLPTEPKPVDLSYEIRGVEVMWEDALPGSVPSWRGWWPALNSKIATERLASSEEEVRLAPLLNKDGRLTLHTLISLPKGKPGVLIRSSRPFEATLFTESVKSKAGPGGEEIAEVSTESTGEPTDLTIVLTTAPGKSTSLLVRAKTSPESAPQDLEGRDLLLPWAPPLPPNAPMVAISPSSYQGGDAKKGEIVFASEGAKCAVCHKFRGKGGDVGPALDEVSSREPAWVYRQVAEPSATIHPEFMPYTVVTKDGRIALGIVRAQGDKSLTVTDTEAKSVTFSKSEVEELRPSNTSIMPVGLTGAIGEASVRDLIAYLTSPAPTQPAQR